VKRSSCVFLSFFAASSLLAWNPFAPKISFDRLVPAEHNLGPAKKLVLVEARGDDDRLDRFVGAMLAAQRREAIEVVDGRYSDLRIADVAGHRQPIEEIPQSWSGADAFLGVELRGCNSHLRSGTKKEKDSDGNKITVTEYWVEADCTAEVRIVDAASAREIATGEVKGEATSSREKDITDSETDSTVDDASEHAGENVYRSFTPRRQSQTLVLDKSAPSFKQAMDRIEAKDLEGARKIFEAALASKPESAALHVNLAELNEVLGDTDAAREHYESAVRFYPSDNNRRWLAEFEKRQAEDAALRTKP